MANQPTTTGNNRGMRTFPFNLFGSLGNFIYGMSRLGIIALGGFFGLLALGVVFCSIYFVSPWWSNDSNAASVQQPVVNHYYTTSNGVAQNGNSGTGLANGNGYSPVDSAVGAQLNVLVRDETEGGCNDVFNPQTLSDVATEQNVHVTVQAHNGPSGLRCILVVQDATREAQIHALTGAFPLVTEIAAVAPIDDRLAPNPSNVQACLNNNLLFNLYTGGPISPDPAKVNSAICN